VALTTVTIGDGLTSINAFAFWDCTHLASVTLPSSVRWIGDRGFGSCTSLVTLAVPKYCQLHSAAFLGCSPQLTWF
jgi:hypothetical protein